MTAPTNTHIEIPDFQALSEQGHWDACAVVAEADALHVCPWRMQAQELSETAIESMRWQYLQAIDPATGKPRWTPGEGTTLGNIHWHLSAMGAHIAGYIPYSKTPDLNALHTFLKSHCLAQNPIIIEVGNAAALPHAEQGVQYHFVTLGGIDSTLGYLVANGDTLDALAGKAGAIVPTYWATWQTLINAKVCGAIALQRTVAVPPPPAPNPTPDMDTLRKLAGEALSALQSMQTILGG